MIFLTQSCCRNAQSSHLHTTLLNRHHVLQQHILCSGKILTKPDLLLIRLRLSTHSDLLSTKRLELLFFPLLLYLLTKHWILCCFNTCLMHRFHNWVQLHSHQLCCLLSCMKLCQTFIQGLHSLTEHLLLLSHLFHKGINISADKFWDWSLLLLQCYLPRHKLV